MVAVEVVAVFKARRHAGHKSRRVGRGRGGVGAWTVVEVIGERRLVERIRAGMAVVAHPDAVVPRRAADGHRAAEREASRHIEVDGSTHARNGQSVDADRRTGPPGRIGGRVGVHGGEPGRAAGRADVGDRQVSEDHVGAVGQLHAVGLEADGRAVHAQHAPLQGDDALPVLHRRTGERHRAPRGDGEVAPQSRPRIVGDGREGGTRGRQRAAHGHARVVREPHLGALLDGERNARGDRYRRGDVVGAVGCGPRLVGRHVGGDGGLSSGRRSESYQCREEQEGVQVTHDGREKSGPGRSALGYLHVTCPASLVSTTRMRSSARVP